MSREVCGSALKGLFRAQPPVTVDVMNRIRLAKGVWTYQSDKPLGRPGGFGAVFLGNDEEGHSVAVKRLHLDAGAAAHRELTVAADLAGRQARHVMPILDAGQDAESDGYFIVMPVAERSLQDTLRDRGPISEGDAVDVMRQIAAGLQEVQHLVHRDLKPANILFHDGRWCIADFGIARFVEDSTSAKTLRECLSPQYAAPEQWRLERVTSATDVYALGCIGYALVTGTPPFAGGLAELQEQHLKATPQDPRGIGAQMRTLLSMMTRKAPEARPSLDRISAILKQIGEAVSSQRSDPALDRLAAAGAAQAQREAQAEAERRSQRDLESKRLGLAAEARATLLAVFNELARRITTSVPNASVRSDASSHVIKVGTATLEMELGTGDGYFFDQNAFPKSGWDVICGASVEVNQATPLHKRAASLWYTKQNSNTGAYRWYEVGYEGNPLTGRGFQFQPAAVGPDLADRAHWHGMDIIQPSYPPIAIDDEDLDAFCQRWAHILAEACDGRLQHLPRRLG